LIQKNQFPPPGITSDYLNRIKVKRSSADFGREGSAVEIDDFEKDIPH
jgi:hypothetical protein